MKKSVGLNAVVNGARTVISLIFPLITYRYITGVLGKDVFGKYSWAHSIANYFYLLAALGIATYAVREGAKYRENKEKLSEFASEVFSISVVSTILSYVLLGISILVFSKLRDYQSLILVLSISMIFTTIGCEWIFTIYEEYMYIAIRSVIFQIFSLAMMFLLVKTKDDVLWYAAVIVMSSSGSNIVNMFGVRKRCNLKFTLNSNVKKHLVPIFMLFANSVATTIYVNSDITILGILATDADVGIYQLSSKIYSITKQVFSAIIIVSIPRLSFYWGSSMKSEFNKLASRILSILMCLVLPATIGLIALGKYIVLFLSTEEFIGAVSSLKILGIALIFCLFNWFFTSCILIPCKREKTVLTATMISAGVNLVLNFALIPFFKADAAAMTTVIAEAVSLAICYNKSRDIFNFTVSKKDIASILFGCGCVFGCCYLTKDVVSNNIVNIFISVSFSVAVYMIVLMAFKNSTFVFLKNAVTAKLKGRRKSKI